MQLADVCDLLHLDRDQVVEMVHREHMPARKAGGTWRFERQELIHWLGEHYLIDLSADRWRRIELGRAARTSTSPLDPLISPRIPRRGILLDIAAKTKASVLRELVSAAENLDLCYDPAELAAALQAREEIGATAVCGGVALPHPLEPIPYTLADSFVLVARTANPIPFGAPDGGLTDIFFLVAAQDESMHLHLLARLRRLVAYDGFLDKLREVPDRRGARSWVRHVESHLVLQLDAAFAGR